MMRGIVSFVTSLLLVLTSHSMAQARNAADATDQMVICAGSQAVVIYIDAQGTPTHAPHVCPDCALHGFDMLGLVPFVPGSAVPKGWHRPQPGGDGAPAQRQPDIMVRGPPPLI